MQPDEALEMERDLQRERRRRSKERQERLLEDGMVRFKLWVFGNIGQRSLVVVAVSPAAFVAED